MEGGGRVFGCNFYNDLASLYYKIITIYEHYIYEAFLFPGNSNSSAAALSI